MNAQILPTILRLFLLSLQDCSLEFPYYLQASPIKKPQKLIFSFDYHIVLLAFLTGE